MRLSDEVLIFEKNQKVREVNSLFPLGSVLNSIIPIQGLQIHEKAIVEKCETDTLHASVSTIELFCGEYDSNPILLRAPAGNTVIAGRLKDKDIRKRKIVLSDFHQFSSRWADRNAERVQPRYPVYFDLHFHDNIVRANLYDLSAIGAGIFITLPDAEDPESLVRTPASFGLRIKPLLDFCRIKGVVENARRISKNLVMLGFRITPPQKWSLALEKYINSRKQEILSGIKSNLNKVLDPPGISQQYF